MPGLRGLEPAAIERLALHAEDSRSLRSELLTRLRAVIEFDWYAWVLTDPTTSVGVDPLAELPDPAAIPATIRLKYLTSLNRWTSLDGVASLATRASESPLWQEEQARHGVVDVASLALRDRYGCWGFLDLWSTRAYAVRELALLLDLAPSLTNAVRLVRARSFHVAGGESVASTGPTVLVLSDDLTILDRARGSEEWLRLLLPQPDGTRPVPACAYNVAAQLLAREAGVDDNPPMARMPLPDGAWVTLRASRLEAHHEIAVTIEQSTPHDRLDVFCRAHGLSPRESELLTVIATGADTATAAAQLHLSPHTIQDHLKAIFAKTDEHSRRELLARAMGTPTI
ncbi:helix-turn-helix transcriptional regulator [Knoellia sp. CPCC 206453]|uniref:helix-turn-helix transcriptional regulator n=1 Tax=Knoellia pratensis TaxID=3404796 RepID=UPI00360AE3DD